MTAASRRTRRPAVHDGVELRCGNQFEDEARAAGHTVVAGVDEVGRGALCGPVVAAAVVLGEGFDCDGLDDSKRLTALQRERLAARIRDGARAVALGPASRPRSTRSTSSARPSRRCAGPSTRCRSGPTSCSSTR